MTNLIVRGDEIRKYKDVMRQLFRIRYENFIVRKSWAMPSRDRMDIDQYDNDSAVYFMSLGADESILCSARITQTVDNSLLADLFPFLIETGEAPRGAHVYEGTRFTLSPKLENRAAIRHVRADLGAEIVNWIRAQGGTQLQAVVDLPAFSAFLAMSLRTRALGLPRDYGGGSRVKGGGRCIAFRWDLDDDLLDDFAAYSRGETASRDEAVELEALH